MQDILQKHLQNSTSRLKTLINCAAQWQKYSLELKNSEPDIFSEFTLNSTLLAHTRSRLHQHIANKQIHWLITQLEEQQKYIDQLNAANQKIYTPLSEQVNAMLSVTTSTIEKLQSDILIQNNLSVNAMLADIPNLTGNMTFPDSQSSLNELAHQRANQKLKMIAETTTELTRQLAQSKQQFFTLVQTQEQNIKFSSTPAAAFFTARPAAPTDQARAVEAPSLKI
jgi:hypothetical protein